MQVLEDVNDRASDTFEPLLVIAEMAGEPWVTQLKEAAKKLCSHQNTEPEAASLLLDIMGVFIFNTTKRLFSRDLAAGLKGKRGWVAYDVTSREPVSELGIAKTLRRYHIRPTTVRIGPEVSKGYKWEDIHQALQRYVPQAEINARLAEFRHMNELAMEAKVVQDKLAAEEQAKADAEAEKAAEGIYDTLNVPSGGVTAAPPNHKGQAGQTAENILGAISAICDQDVPPAVKTALIISAVGQRAADPQAPTATAEHPENTAIPLQTATNVPAGNAV